VLQWVVSSCGSDDQESEVWFHGIEIDCSTYPTIYVGHTESNEQLFCNCM
jgi:hypothetical protein